jgi:Myosin head (motor domain)
MSGETTTTTTTVDSSLAVPDATGTPTTTTTAMIISTDPTDAATGEPLATPVTVTVTVTVTDTAAPATPATTATSTPLTLNPTRELNKTANHVYIQDETSSWIPAQVLERPHVEDINNNNNNKENNNGPVVVVVNVPLYTSEQAIQCDGGKHARKWERRSCDLRHYPNQALPLQNVNAEGSLQVVEDMVDLPFLHEVRLSLFCWVVRSRVCFCALIHSLLFNPTLYQPHQHTQHLKAAILYNLKARHVHQQPYTRTGDIVIAVNPYVWIPDLYSYQQRQYYGQSLVWNHYRYHPTTTTTAPTSPTTTTATSTTTTVDDPRKHLPPHVYEASCLAYRGLMRQKIHQSILVSGESGAGKTETVKILLGDIANVQRGPVSSSSSSSVLGVMDRRTTTTGTSTSSSHNLNHNHHNNPIVQKVLDSNPLLEAFGNAQTLRNDNSSRFGKYLQLQFDCISEFQCTLAGSTAEVYLLEKSRVTLHHPHERTFHIFYQLLAADDTTKAQIWKGLVDTDNESFCYVGFTQTTHIEGMSDAERFQQTVQALTLIGITGDRLLTLWRALCIVLQLGNLEFTAHSTNTDASVLADEEELKSLSHLMGIDATKLTTALTIRTVEARSELFSVPLTADKAKESTDAFAKEIYAKTFLWLVRTINDATCAELNYHGGHGGGGATQRNIHVPSASNAAATMSLADTIRARTAAVAAASTTTTTTTTTSPTASITTTTTNQRLSLKPLEFGVIGLLDIFGFETFEVNRFEQLCINYCNEKLQQKFTQDIFRSVQLEYEMEGIALEEITYDDNTDVLDLVEGRMGLLAFLNEECVRPKGSDKTFVYKAESCNKDNPCFVRAKHAQDHEFGIRHYAGVVMYDATNFVVKNMVRSMRDDSHVFVFHYDFHHEEVRFVDHKHSLIFCPLVCLCVGYPSQRFVRMCLLFN